MQTPDLRTIQVKIQTALTWTDPAAQRAELVELLSVLLLWLDVELGGGEQDVTVSKTISVSH